ncbi:GNAT family N-acetyltransferase [Candidatus Micrarchaeota archaeon]|nr:GNAT family N-acetyltransferase [Candidatus Micrarchaeota archaeon]
MQKIFVRKARFDEKERIERFVSQKTRYYTNGKPAISDFTKSSLLSDFGRSGVSHFLAFVGEKLVGVASTTADSSSTHFLESSFVHPDFRSSKLASEKKQDLRINERLIFHRLQHLFENEGAREVLVLLPTSSPNEPIARKYEALGFKPNSSGFAHAIRRKTFEEYNEQGKYDGLM